MTINAERRRAVMARSQTLGHCICNPRHPCPCPPLLEHNVCPCAGERLPKKPAAVPLTRYVRRAGCASKIGQADLHDILAALPPVTDPNVLVGAAAGDDAGVYKLDERRALVQTVDVFTPCVDDPYLFGQIAAANSVSDVYAMGGTPVTALSIVGFPIETLDGSVMERMLRGGMDKLEEAGCALLGGHSINDEEIKCGFAVTGLIDLEAPVLRDAAQPGDVLILTKPLGTGVIAFAAQLGRVSEAVLAETGAWMAALNKDAAELMAAHGAHACTDVTGFGLAGHLAAMARGSGVCVEIDLAATPVFAMAAECVRNDLFGGAVDRNRADTQRWVHAPEDADPRALALLFDPQTSGGLLIALPPENGERFLEAMRARGHDAAAVIGRVRELPSGETEGRIVVVHPELRTLIGRREPLQSAAELPSRASVSYEDVSCCDAPPHILPETTPTSPPPMALEEPIMSDSAPDALALFSGFMKEANKPGLIDARAKKLMAIALSIAQRCEPCLAIHLESAKKMGLSAAEIDEAAHLAIAFGGCTALMFYKDARRKAGLDT